MHTQRSVRARKRKQRIEETKEQNRCGHFKVINVHVHRLCVCNPKFKLEISLLLSLCIECAFRDRNGRKKKRAKHKKNVKLCSM